MESPKRYKRSDHSSQRGKGKGHVKYRIGRMEEQMRKVFGKK